ncbi:hypothetical protein BGZ49_004992 [Haplosporangium sp. Z 27]|nr:hypothetical protein BGZ49_004992 [Haplosporangium sp. Z 27]
MPGKSNACVNEFEESKWSNSGLCAVQGVLIIYLAQTSVLWCALLIYKLHLLAILSSKVDSAMSQMSANARMKFTSSMQAKRLLRGQWRPALMLGTVMASITVFWLFYYIDTRRMANVNSKTEWLLQWLECLKSSASEGLSSDEAQTICSDLIKSNLPSIPWFGAAETLIAIIGIVIAVVFVTKVDFWTEWLSTVSGFFTKDKPDPDKEQQTSSVIDKPSGVDQNPSHSQYNDTIIRKGTRVGYNDELPTHVATDNEALTLPRLESFEVPQWYNMDDLLAQEYGQNDTNLQMSTSHGSKHGMTSASNQMPNTEPPHYLAKDSHDPNSGDILSPPVEELEPWTLSSPSNAYLVANDSSDRYVEQPVVPRPVPRASSLKREKVQQQHQNQQDQEQLSSTSQSLPFVQKSLSPMPPKPLNQSPAPFLPRKKESDSAPIINIQGSPATSNANPSSTNKAALVNSNESNNKTLQVSGESSTNLGNSSFIGRGLNKIRSSELLGRISPKTKAALEAQIKNQIPPTIPQKSPARRQNSVSSKSQHQYQPPQQQSEGQRSYLQSRSPPTSPVESTQ